MGLRAAVVGALAALALSIGIAACSDPESPPISGDAPQRQAEPQQTGPQRQQVQPAQQPQPSRPATGDVDDSMQESVPQFPSDRTQSGRQAEQWIQAAEQATVERPPPGTRVVSLFGDVTEILYALDLEEYIVGVDVSSVYPEQARQFPNVGFAGALNAEGILALNPSIVIGGSIVTPGPPGVIEQLEQAGVEILVLPELVGLDGPVIKIRAIGQALGIPERAEALARRVEREIEEAKSQPAVGDAEPLSVLFVYIRRGGIQLVSGAGREAETIITAAGGVDAGAAADIEGWQSLSPEALLSINPDVYLVMELGYNAVGGLDRLLEIPGMAETTAGKHRRVIVMEDILLLGFGPRMAESIVQLRDYLTEVQESLDAGSESSR